MRATKLRYTPLAKYILATKRQVVKRLQNKKQLFCKINKGLLKNFKNCCIIVKKQGDCHERKRTSQISQCSSTQSGNKIAQTSTQEGKKKQIKII